MEKGSERRKGLIDVCRIRYTLARQKVEGLVACGAVDKDRVSKRLKSDLEEARDAGGGDRVWAVMRAVGRARADLVGKKMKPRGGVPGMRAIRPWGMGKPMPGKPITNARTAKKQCQDNQKPMPGK